MCLCSYGDAGGGFGDFWRFALYDACGGGAADGGELVEYGADSDFLYAISICGALLGGFDAELLTGLFEEIEFFFYSLLGVIIETFGETLWWEVVFFSLTIGYGESCYGVDAGETGEPEEHAINYFTSWCDKAECYLAKF